MRLIHSIDIYCTPNLCPEGLGAGDLELELRHKQRPTQGCGKQGWLTLCEGMSNGRHSLTQPARRRGCATQEEQPVQRL